MKKKIFIVLLVVMLALQMMGAQVLVGQGADIVADTVEDLQQDIREMTEDIGFDISKYFNKDVAFKLPATIDDNDEISIIVEMSNISITDSYISNDIAGAVDEYISTNEASAIIANNNREMSYLLKQLDLYNVDYAVGAEYDVVTSGFEIVIKAQEFDKVDKAIGDDATLIVSEVYEVAQTEVVHNDVNVYDTGIFDSSESKYDGSGTVVAVLDSGFDYTHTAYSADRFTSTNLAMDRDYVGSKLDATKASGITAGLTKEDVYINDKIPFAYDYADSDPDVLPIRSDHGTHVASIIGGNDDTIMGVAPNAQLVLMKVFSDLQQGARDAWILAALEDCVTLGVDVINMSLGTAAGFAREVDKKNTNEIYDSIEAAGISLVTSISNSYNSAMGSTKNGNLPLTSNPDSAMVGAPGVYESTLGVASISGVKTPYIGFGDEVIYYNEATDAGAEQKKFVEDLLPNGIDEQTFEYVVIPGVGRGADYHTDVKGKIVLVRRGDTSFEDKANVAEAKGAAGIIIYNNVSGDISMTVGDAKLAVCSISQDNGEKLVNATDKKIVISTTQLAGPFMSDFSSWGPTPGLGIKPEITAHGGDILAAVPGQGYDRLSGTSMSSPNQAGFNALVRQYVEETFPEIVGERGNASNPFNPSAVLEMVNQLVMSTTDIAYNTNGLPFAVRKQGAGLANLTKATTTPAYLAVPDGEGGLLSKTKLELGDDAKKTGVYEMQFVVINVSDAPVKYLADAIVMTEGVSETKTHQGQTTVTQLGYLLEGADVAVTKIDGGSADGNTISVGAGNQAVVTLTITLSDADKKYLDDSFANGMYVEGYVTLEGQDGNTVDLSAPYLAFYGDWTQAPMLDLDYFETNKDELDDGIDQEDKTMADGYATRPIGGLYRDYISYLGSYYFMQNPGDNQIEADRKYISLSNQEEAINSIYGVWFGLLRNAKEVVTTIVDDVTGEVVYTQTDYNQRKSYNYGSEIGPSSMRLDFDITDYNLKNNSRYVVKFDTKLDYGDGGVDTNLNNTFEFPFVTDFQAPTVTDVRFYTEYNETEQKTYTYASIDVFDNHYSMALSTGYVYKGINQDGEEGLIYSTFEQYLTPIYGERNSTSTIVVDITDYIESCRNSHNPNTIIFGTYDYAMNNAMYEVPLPTNITGLYFEDEQVTLNPNEIYELQPKFYPEDAISSMITYESTDDTVATVVNGKVVAYKKGTTTITAFGQEGTQATLTINVLGEGDDGYIKYDPLAAQDFVLKGYHVNKAFYRINSKDRDIGSTGYDMKFVGNNYSLSMFPSESVTLQHQLTSYFPAGTTVTYQANNDRIATVTDDGTVVAQQQGSTSITLNVLLEGERTYFSASVFVNVKDPYEAQSSYLMAYRGLGGVVEVPAELSIKEIQQYAFSQYEYVDKEPGDEISEEDPSLTKPMYIGEDSITKVVLPEGVEKIHDFAFAGLTSLEEVVLPSTLRYIGQGAFENCEALKVVTGLEHVQFINNNAFSDCALEEALLDSAVGIGYEAFARNNLTTVHLPATAQSLGTAAFIGNFSLEQVTIDAKLIKLGDSVFQACTKLTDITVNAQVIPSSAFAYAQSLETVTFGKDVAVIGANAFVDTKINKFVVHEDNQTFASTNDGAMLLNKAGDTVLLVAPQYGGAVLTLPNTITTIGNSAFNGNAKIRFVTMPNVTTIGDYAFANCEQLIRVTASNLTNIGDYAFLATTLKGTPVLDNVEYIGEGAFMSTAVESVTIADNTVIGVGAFYNCANLDTVTIGNDVNIGNLAFGAKYDQQYNFATSLVNLTIGDNATIGVQAFSGAVNLGTVTLGDGATLGNQAFYNCPALVNIDLSGVTSIGEGAFFGLQLQGQNASGATQYYYFSASMTDVDLSSATYVGAYAFAYCFDITNVTLSAELDTIGKFAFFGAQSLANIDLSNVEYIGERAFTVTALATVDLTSAKEIGEEAFLGTEALTTVTLGNKVNIGDGAFSACTALDTVNNLQNANNIGVYAFANTDITNGDLSAVQTIGDFAFANTGLTAVTFSEDVTYIGENPFAGCTALSEFSTVVTKEFGGTSYNETVTTFAINDYAQVVEGVLYVDVPNGLELTCYPLAKQGNSYTIVDGTIRVSSQAFALSQLNFVQMPRDVEALGHKAFYGCTELTSVTFYGIYAPILEEEYDIEYLNTFPNNIPHAGPTVYPVDPSNPLLGYAEGLGIVDYFMWNMGSDFSTIFFGATFGDYIGHNQDNITMIRPSNGEGYDTFIYNQYFGAIINGATAPNDLVLLAIDAINALPERVKLTDEQAVLDAREQYDLIIGRDQQALVTNYDVLVEAEERIEFLKTPSNPEPPTPPVDPEPANGDNITLIIVLSIVGIAVVATGVVLWIHFAKKNTKAVKEEE